MLFLIQNRTYHKSVSHEMQEYTAVWTKTKGKGVHMIQESDESDLDDKILHINVNSIQGHHSKPIIVRLTIAGRITYMVLDTILALSIISE